MVSLGRGRNLKRAFRFRMENQAAPFDVVLHVNEPFLPTDESV